MKRLLLRLVVLASVAVGAGVFVTSARSLAFDESVCPVGFVDPSAGEVHVCPQGAVDQPYSVQLKGRPGTGCVPYVTFSTTGGLPPGVTLSSSGLISGTPTGGGVFSFWVSITDIPASQGGVSWCADDNSSSRLFQITVQGGQPPQPSLTIDQQSLAPTLVNSPYSVQLTASGGGTQTWSLSSGAPPPGITLSHGGLLSGTPTATGSYTFAVKVVDTGSNRSNSKTFTLQVLEPLSIEQQALAPTFVNAPYSVQLTASGGGTQTWSLSSGTLPPGLTLSTGGLLSGTPTTTGSYTFVVKVADTGSNRSDTKTLTLNVLEPLAATAPSPAPKAEVSAAYGMQLTATGGTGPYTFAVTQGALPDGLTLDSATGRITGVPTTAGPSSSVVTVTDANHFTTTLSLAVNVKAKLTILTRTLKVARVRSLYRVKVQTLGGYAPYRWSVSGKLPPGIHFNPATAAFVGTPRKAGSYRVTVRATDRLGVASKQTLAFKVLKARR